VLEVTGSKSELRFESLPEDDPTRRCPDIAKARALLGWEPRARFEEFANEAACPALDPATGLCQLYAWRPMTCRVFGPPVRMDTRVTGGEAFGHCELCFAGASTTEVAACEMRIPHEVEARLLNEIPLRGETVVAFALLM
jgi:Fe-S-cluster containining protein